MQIILVLWITQLLTVGLAWLAFGSSDPLQIAVVAAISMGLGVLVSIWVGAKVRTERRLLQAHHRELASRSLAEHQRELFRQKAQDMDLLKNQAQTSARSGKRLLRTGLLAGGAAGAAATLLVVQSALMVALAMVVAAGAFAGLKLLDRGSWAPPRTLAAGSPGAKASGWGRLGRPHWLRKVPGRPYLAVPHQASGKE